MWYGPPGLECEALDGAQKSNVVYWVYFSAKIVQIEWIQCVSRFRVQDSFVSHFESFNRTSSKESLVCEKVYIGCPVCLLWHAFKQELHNGKMVCLFFFFSCIISLLSHSIQTPNFTSFVSLQEFLPRWLIHVQKLLTKPSITKILGSVFFKIQNQFWTSTILDSQFTPHFSCETQRLHTHWHIS